MKKLILVLKTIITIAFLIFTSYTSLAQGILDKIEKKARKIKEAARQTKIAANEVTGATIAITTTVKTLKQTWAKDTSANIKYYQVPDYRSREEVNISKRQKLGIENGQFKNLDWQPEIRFDNQVFPSFIIGWATYTGTKEEDMGSSLGFTINTSLSNVVLKWEIECINKNYFNIDSGYINCNEVRNTRPFMPRIAWNMRALVKHETAAPLGIYFRLIDPNTGGKVERLVNINLRSINDCMTYYNNRSYRNMLVAFANEEHPEVDKILKEALDTKMIDNISGYQSYGDKEKLTKEKYEEAKKYVDLQVAAIWRVLHNRGFQYSNITDNTGDNSGRLFSQTVRKFDNSIKTSQANCVDGTIVFASVLKRMGLKPKLVLVPGHCFLAYSDDDNITDNITFLETTMLSNDRYMSKDSVARYRKDFIVNNYPKALLPKATVRDLQFFLQFTVAELAAKATFLAMQKEGKVEIIDLIEERKKIKPIPVLN